MRPCVRLSAPRPTALTVTSFSIRTETVADEMGVLACLRVAFAPYQHVYTPQAFDDTVLTPASFPQRLASMDVLVAVSSTGEIVGTIACAAVGDGEGHIRGMAVRPEYHGKGLAQQLLHTAEEALRSRGCGRVTLDTTAPLERAMRFYEKNGYRRSGRVPDFFGMKLFEYQKIFC